MSEASILSDLKNLSSKDSNSKWIAVNNLGKYLRTNPTSDFRSKMIVKSFLSMVKDPDDKIREEILSILFDIISEKQRLEPLVRGSLTDSNPGIRSLALEWLSEQNHRALKTQAIRALNDSSDIVRKTAIDIIVKHKIEGVEQQLLKLLELEKGGVRRTVIYALGKLKTAQAISTLVDIMRNPNFDDWTRNQASSALDHMGGTDLIIPFIENLSDENDYVRETAASFLSKNTQDIASVVLSSARLDLIALLHYGTESTKQNFSDIVTTLTRQMDFAIQDIRTKITNKDQFNYSELATEYQTTEKAIKILIEKLLEIRAFPLADGTYLTESGLKKNLAIELENNNSLNLLVLSKKKPYKQIQPSILSEITSSIPSIYQVSQNLFLIEKFYSKILSDFEHSGLIDLPFIHEEIKQPIETIKNELVPVLDPSKEGWFNSKDEYLTLRFLQNLISDQINKNHIISLPKFLTEIGNPKIDFSVLKGIIDTQFTGNWLDDIHVFIEKEEFEKIKQDSTRIDEERLSELLIAINMDFSRFLSSLSSLIPIHTFQTKDKKLVSLESLHPQLQQEILGRRYINLTEFLKQSKLDKTPSVKPAILDFITQEFSGRTNPEATYFFTEELIESIRNEVNTQFRINFNVLGFKLDLPIDILTIVINKILFLRGFINTIGEFVTEKGIEQEINGILEYREEFPLQELFEILEITDNAKKKQIVLEFITENKDLIVTKDEKILTQKMAMNHVISYIKHPNQQVKERLGWNEISIATNLPSNIVRLIIESLVQNNLLPGKVHENGYHP